MGKRKGPKYEQIIEAAVDVIAENGYYNSQVSKIAKRAGVADGTIYLYFANKEDVLISVFEEKMGQFITNIKDELTSRLSVEEKLHSLVANHFRQLSLSRNLAIVTQLELRQSSSHLRKQINDILKEYLIIMDGLIEEGKATGVFSDDLNEKLARQMIFGTIDEVVTTWIMNEYRYDLNELAAPVASMLLQGFGANVRAKQ
ncbi:TetR/AcrR family transcriptional regulator [Sinobaca sp. H24]|uniref:TetR/AcrR family transcriptional regulator n=1 Tax=Sinobaca sp. H24 TaxID=2923376 RepID=UPI00207A9398|nr:TetR/AcrR family transcriptional regulator [Sinobaca sp. H24]